jgi:hypothetical protein
VVPILFLTVNRNIILLGWNNARFMFSFSSSSSFDGNTVHCGPSPTFSQLCFLTQHPLWGHQIFSPLYDVVTEFNCRSKCWYFGVFILNRDKCSFHLIVLLSCHVAQSRHLSYCGTSLCFYCSYQPVSFVITTVSTSWTSLNVWPSGFTPALETGDNGFGSDQSYVCMMFWEFHM